MGGANSSEAVDISSNSALFNNQELKALKSAYESGGMKNVAILIQQKFKMLEGTKLHIAVTGESGTGKSSFINSMRGLRRSDEGAAETGNIETTMQRTEYKHPSFPNVSFWDLPGVGTITFPMDEYPTKMKFEEYDFFIIISGNRFTKNDANLAEEVKKMGKNFYFVRSQIDNDLRAHQHNCDEADCKAELVKIRNYCIKCLKEAGILQPKVFLVSSFQVNEFDFPKLMETLANNLDNVKRDLLLISLQSTTENILECKRDQLKKRIWMLAATAGIVGIMPIPGMDIDCNLGILVTAIVEFRKCLGLDAASIQSLADATENPVSVLSAEVNTHLAGEIDIEFVKNKLQNTKLQSAVAVARFIPVLGSMFAAGSSFAMIYKLLNDVLDELVENARGVMKIAFKSP
ncbi:T-cell-specific guanine nucleotide triphosphate-binding protein 2-like [Pristis pectinata]|uniref:T-cell-specific guanine nucleotide triphosphate-binding protein 2-like n=1 Tax=Pristis pectinata TaxID=685728 RepID=UPI00223E2CBA|nr:T-cell-specific guanine nucleotide triphosphate-binding protein 2-like [Pristis pectinata]XP_051878027.1 T-cell-specific guanine nucleotide triphosphate-binding protein 2-like [Pristis pectinata]